MKKKIKELAERYGRKTDVIEIVKDIIEETSHINAFSHPECAIVTGDNELQHYRWGLIPFWTKTEKDAQKVRNMTLNSRSETIFKLPSYREPILRKRCLIPSTGYMEYHHTDDRSTIPYYIFLRDQEIFSMAGIYDVWLDKQTGEQMHTFSMITTEANLFTAKIHNGGKNPFRMPVIIHERDEEKWLDPQLGKTDIEKLMRPFEANKMDAYPINKNFIRKNPKDASILKNSENN